MQLDPHAGVRRTAGQSCSEARPDVDDLAVLDRYAVTVAEGDVRFAVRHITRGALCPPSISALQTWVHVPEAHRPKKGLPEERCRPMSREPALE
eukprot:1441912-Prymnesium_polylepis.1